jgi:hypothetical protein
VRALPEPEKAIIMLLLGISVLLVLVAGLVVLAVALRRCDGQKSPLDTGGVEQSVVPDELLEAEHVVTHQLFTGWMVRSQYRRTMAELARRSCDYRRVT